MTRRTIATAGLAIMLLTAFATAQPPAPQAYTPSDPKALRARVAQLGAEVELLQIDYEADRATLLEAVKMIRQSEMLAELGDPRVQRVGAYAALGKGGDEANRAINAAAAKGVSTYAAGQEFAKNAEVKRVETIRRFVERKKKEFARQAAELSERRMDLADAEKALAASRP